MKIICPKSVLAKGVNIVPVSYTHLFGLLAVQSHNNFSVRLFSLTVSGHFRI